MKIIKPPKTLTCDICDCMFEITEKDICTEVGQNGCAYETGPTTTQGRKFVFCPVCHIKIYLKKDE